MIPNGIPEFPAPPPGMQPITHLPLYLLHVPLYKLTCLMPALSAAHPSPYSPGSAPGATHDAVLVLTIPVIPSKDII